VGIILVNQLAHKADPIQIAGGRDLVRNAEHQPWSKKLDETVIRVSVWLSDEPSTGLAPQYLEVQLREVAAWVEGWHGLRLRVEKMRGA
jgi:hypothetical protein